MEELFVMAEAAEMVSTEARVDKAGAGRMLLTVEQAASLLGVGRTTMFALIRNGEVGTVQIGRLRRIRPADLATYVDRLSAVARKAG
jgi:excisionase family DNA binding protein